MKLVKNGRRAVALLTAVLLLLGLMPFSAMAEKEAQVLLLNTPVEVTGTTEDPAKLAFIPPESGTYVFRSLSGNDPQAWLYSSDDAEVLMYADDTDSSMQFRLVYQLTGDLQYYFYTNDRDNDEPFTVEISPAVMPTSIDIVEDEITVPLCSGSYPFYVTILPEEAEALPEITVQNEDVLSVYREKKNTYYIQPNCLGTTTVTLAVGELTDSVTVNVVEPTAELVLGENPISELNSSYHKAYTFTVSESADYCFKWEYVDLNGSIYVSELTDDGRLSYVLDGQYAVDTYAMGSAYLDKDSTYVVTLCVEKEEGDLGTLTIAKAVDATAIRFAEGDGAEMVYGTVEYFNLRTVTLPDMAKIENIVSWNSTDATVATVNEYGGVQICGKGTTTITATSENNLVATFVLTVGDPQAIELDQEYTFTYKPGLNTGYYTFTPAKSGFYDVMVTTQSGGGYLRVYQEGEFLHYVEGDGRVWLEAGVTYDIELVAESNSTVTMLWSEPEVATDVEIWEKTVTLYLTDEYYLSYELLPEGALDPQCTFTSSDDSVVMVDEYGVLRPVAPGKATVTVSIPGGGSDTVEVTVPQPLTWQGMGTKHVILNPIAPEKVYLLTVDEDGWYAFSTDGSCNAELELYRKTQSGPELLDGAESENGEPISMHMYLFANQEYYLEVGADEELIAFDVTLGVGEEQEAGVEVPEEGFVLLRDEYTVTLGDLVGIEAVFAYDNYIDDLFVEDDTVISWDRERLVAIGIGTTTATVMDAFGNEEEITMTVQAAEEIRAGDVKKLVFENGISGEGFRFVPATDGYYAFGLNSVYDTFVVLLDEDFNMITYNDDFAGMDARLDWELEAGETYYVIYTTYSAWWGDGYAQDASVEIFAVKTEAATALQVLPDVDGYLFEEDGLYYMELYQGMDYDVNFVPYPMAATAEILSIESSNEQVIEAYDQWVESVGVGEATVTIIAEGGLTATLKLKVIDPILGDANTDGVVDEKDLQMLRDYLDGKADLGRRLYLLQMNEDEAVDENDYALLKDMVYDGLLGDVDGSGKVDSTDARLVLQYAVKKIPGSALELSAADVNGDGKVDSTDARLILQYAVKKINNFPAA